MFNNTTSFKHFQSRDHKMTSLSIRSIADHSFQIFLKDIGYITTIFLYYGYIFLKDIGYITTSTNSHIKCIVCICVSFLYICLTSETLHYPWIPSSELLSISSSLSDCILSSYTFLFFVVTIIRFCNIRVTLIITLRFGHFMFFFC